jgi:uncharacterized repeat protein (TIGR01451 family)
MKLLIFILIAAAIPVSASNDIFAGDYRVFRIGPGGTVWAWGWNTGGILGDGTTTSRLVPVQVPGLTGIVAVEPQGPFGAMALKEDGTVWTWPSYDSSQSPSVPVLTPVQMPGLSEIKAIACGRLHVLALKTDGTVWAWGNNQRGELGTGNTSPAGTPVQVTGLTDVIAIDAGNQYSLALKSDGTVWSWGSSASGQLGIPYDGQIRKIPGPVSLSGGFVAIAAGYNHALALHSNGTVWAWGENYSFQIGVEWRVQAGGSFPYEYLPVQVPQVEGATAIAAGSNHSAAIRADGTLLIWGSNSYGLLGLGDLRPNAPPTAVPGLGPVRAVALSSTSTYALQEDGQFFAWGSKLQGALGNGEDGKQKTPTLIPDLNGVTAMAATSGHTLALLSDGTVYAWGTNDRGQLGDGSTEPRITPAPVPDLSNVVAITADSNHSLALKDDGTVWSWGSSWSEVTPEGNPLGILVPTRFDALADVSALSVSNGHAVALKQDGSVWAWGDDSYGAVSGRLYEKSYYATPVAVAGLPADITSIAACARNNLALQSNGDVWAWGDGSTKIYGPLNFDSAAPAVVQGLSGIVKIACGDFHYIALQNDGTTWIWGSNYAAALGLGVSVDSLPPTRLEALPDVAAIACDLNLTVALRNDGSVWTWGADIIGTAGTAPNANHPVPEPVPELADTAAVFAGGTRAFALTHDGKLYGWGAQGSGQLGDGSLDFAASPVLISDPAPPDLSPTLAIAAGDNLTLTLTVTNQGGLILEGETKATITLPPGLTFVPTETPAWSCAADAAVVNCATHSPLGGGQRVTLPLTLTLAPEATEPLEIHAEVTNPADANPDNNQATLTLTPGPTPPKP